VPSPDCNWIMYEEDIFRKYSGVLSAKNGLHQAELA